MPLWQRAACTGKPSHPRNDPSESWLPQRKSRSGAGSTDPTRSAANRAKPLCGGRTSAIIGSAMTMQRLARLTEQQRICLRHVYAHKTSKEIAPLLGIEPGSVDQHIKGAMRILGVADRRSAARLLAEHDNPGLRPLVYQSPELVPEVESATIASSIGSGRGPYGGWPGSAMREEQTSFRVLSRAGAPTLPLPIGETRPGDLSWIARLAWIAGLAIGIAVAFGGLVSGVETLGRLIGR
jgi:DNA-binding CsgD family transcriptional regulator